MSQSRKITPYIPYSLPINSFQNHKDLLRKRPSKVVQMRIAETMRSYPFPQPYCSKLRKLLRHIKGLKRLSIDHFRLLRAVTSASLISLVKKIRRVQELALKDFWAPIVHLKTKLPLWIKYIDRLQKLIFKLEIWKNKIFQKDGYSSHIKSFLKPLKNQNQIKSFKVQLPQKASFVNPILLQSSKYPKSLEKIQFLLDEKEYEGSDDKLRDFDLNSFKKLKTFALQTTNDYFVTSRLIDTLPSLPHLKSLKILIPHSFVIPEASISYGRNYYHVDSQAFSHLTHLSIRIPNEYTEVTLLERLNLENLQSLQLSHFILNCHKYQAILPNLSRMKNLKALNLSIFYFKQLENLTKFLFENLVDLELLTSLRISLASAIVVPDDRPTERISSDVLPALNKILQKSIKIEDFSFECKELIIANEFEKLMEIFNASALNFKKFKLDSVPLGLNERNIEMLAGFVEGLKNVKTLKLPCFDVNSNQILTSLTSGLVKLKEIRSIYLGKIGGEGVTEQNFIESLERILEKRGLCTFKGEITEDMRTRLNVICEPNAPLSFEEISKKNPFLKFVSEDLWVIMNRQN